MNSIDELKNQKREITRKLKEVREQEIEKAIKNFMKMVLDDSIPLYLKEESIIDSFKSTITDIFND